MKNQLRIIGGEWKRRQLPFAPIEDLRPTPDRVRETLFNWLMWDIQNAKVLDLCAGSGALSFEALSRGASNVIMIEPSSLQAKFLKENLELLRVTNQRAKIKISTAQQMLAGNTEQFDLVFLDPPYSMDLWEELSVLTDPHIVEKGLIYVEADQDLSRLKLPSHWQQLKSTKAGSVRAGLYQKVTQA